MSGISESGVFPQLETARLTLREITMDDLDWYARHFSRKEIVEGSGRRGPRDMEAARKEMVLYIIGLFRDGKGFRWGMALKGAKDLIGSCGFYNWNREGESQADIGYDLDPNYWGQGLMREALSEIIRFGFEKMNLHRKRCLILPRNTRSTNLIQRLGFRKDGIVRECTDEQGRPTDDVVFSTTRKEWDSMQTCQ